MKKEEGITLMSLIIYILLLFIVVTLLANMSSMFFKNVDVMEENSKYSGEFNKFSMYFIEDVKNNSKVYSLSESGNKLVFLDGTTYKYQDNAIYRDKVKICSEITECTFTKRIDNSTGIDKEIINIEIGIGGTGNFKVNNDYVLKYW